MSDIELNGVKYRTGKMDVFAQAHVARKVMPVVMGMGQGFAAAAQRSLELLPGPVGNGAVINGADTEGEAEAPAEVTVDPQMEARENAIMFEALTPIAEVLSAMKDEDFDYILRKCLSVVQRSNGERYVPLMRGGSLMFDDIDLGTLTQLTMEVIQENLGPTFLGLVGLGSAGTATSTSPSPQ